MTTSFQEKMDGFSAFLPEKMAEKLRISKTLRGFFWKEVGAFLKYCSVTCVDDVKFRPISVQWIDKFYF